MLKSFQTNWLTFAPEIKKISVRFCNGGSSDGASVWHSVTNGDSGVC